MITRRTLLLSTPFVVLAPRARAKGIPVTLYRDPGCGCCENYVAYLRRHGFDVAVKSASPGELAAISRKTGIPPDLQGCHTAFIAGYAVDGLVPIAVLQRLLKDRPPLKGITLPGMPEGAPGMPEMKKGKLTVFAIPKEGNPSVFMTF